MANEFIARKGLIVLANGAVITGSLKVDTSVTASAFRGDGANLTNLPFDQLTGVPTGIVSGSTQTIINIAGQQISPLGVTSSLLGNASSATSASYALTASYAANVPTLVQSASYAVSASAATSITFVPATASYATTAQSVIGGIDNAQTASYVLYDNVKNKPTLVSSSAQISYTGITNVPVGIVSSSGQVSFLGLSNVPTLVSSSTQIVYTSISGIPIGIVSSSTQISYTSITGVPSGIVSSSTQTITHLVGQAIAPATVNGIHVPSLATTGSNTFVGLQTFDNIRVMGSSSIMNVTSSQVNIGNNKLVLNSNDLTRYGGLSIYDSGSSQRSGSMYWDSLRDTFITEQVGAVAGIASSSLFILGPRSSAGLGTEAGLTTNRVPKASSDDVGQHIIDSQIIDDGTTVSVPGILNVGASALIAGALYTTGSAAVNIGTFVIASVSTTLYDGAVFNYVIKNLTSVRTGQVYAAWSGSSNIEWTDSSTRDIGNTTDVEFVMDILAGNARLKATSISNSWTVKAIVQAI